MTQFLSKEGLETLASAVNKKIKTASDAAVKKAGDTMTADLTVNSSGTTVQVGHSGVTVAKTGSNATTYIDQNSISAPKLVKTGGTATQVLMADGTVKTLSAANGIPILDANGRIPLSQLGNLDTTVAEVVSALPTTNIKKHIYMVKASETTDKNIYKEYIYTGDVSATYDATKWEQLGEYKSDIDLSDYAKKSATIGKLTGRASATAYGISATKADGTVDTVNPLTINAATTSAAGVMTAEDKKLLDTLGNRYPLTLTAFTASPNLIEVNAATDVTFSWSYSNSDFHAVSSQGFSEDGSTYTSVAVGTSTYKKTALAALTASGSKTFYIRLNNSDSIKKSVAVTYHYPTYVGVVASGATINEAAVKALTKSVEWGKGKTATLALSNQKIVYAFPVAYGALTSIKDGNGFEGINGYTRTTVKVDNVDYYVYTQNIAATSASQKYTFA